MMATGGYITNQYLVTSLVVKQSDNTLREVIQLVSEWVSGYRRDHRIDVSCSYISQLIPTTYLNLYELQGEEA